MELDDLKQSWNEQSKQELKPLNNNIMEMIHNKSYGPLAVLKNKLKKQLIVFPMGVAVFIYLVIKKPELMYNSFMYYFFFCFFVLTSFYWMNYKLIGRIQNVHSTVKETIQNNIKTLESNFKKYFIVGRLYLLITIVLLETFMHFHELPDFEVWYNYSIFIRIAVYIALFILIYFVGKYSYQKNYGKHISYLKELLNKIE